MVRFVDGVVIHVASEPRRVRAALQRVATRAVLVANVVANLNSR
jgi:hypothetical protein